jgi:hypothetical protein
VRGRTCDKLTRGVPGGGRNPPGFAVTFRYTNQSDVLVFINGVSSTFTHIAPTVIPVIGAFLGIARAHFFVILPRKRESTRRFDSVMESASEDDPPRTRPTPLAVSARASLVTFKSLIEMCQSHTPKIGTATEKSLVILIQMR